ncbi:MAG TPA: M48 family metalloprotease [Alphaproteobacteria bacterium]
MKTIYKTLLLLGLCALMPLQAFAQGTRNMSIIRDTEIEEDLKAWTQPIFNAAGLNPQAVDIILVQSPELNAFVAGGSNIFIYTGLIAATKNPGELLGVIAHETGHIAGGHLIRGREAMEYASYEAILATLLGIGAGAIGGGDAGAAILRGGQGAAMSSYLSHSRTQESSADQAGLRYLEASGYNPTGLASFMETLQDQELLPQSQQNAYVRTHPLTRDRIASLEAGVAKSNFLNQSYSPAMVDQFNRIRAKLIAFIEPQRVTWLYGEKDTSPAALYARAIAAYRRSEKDKALSLINQLLAKEPNNAYAHEVRGQMLRDFGQISEAAAAYRKAIALKPNAALIRIDLAQVLIEQAGKNGNAALYAEAEKNLDQAVAKETRSGTIHRLYATLYGRQGQDAKAQYHLAEEAALGGRTKEAQKLLTGAMAGLKPGTRDYRKAMDLKLYLDTKPKKDDDEDDEEDEDERQEFGYN